MEISFLFKLNYNMKQFTQNTSKKYCNKKTNRN